MIKISILYPNNKGARFDMRYYVDTHMPLSIELLSGPIPVSRVFQSSTGLAALFQEQTLHTSQCAIFCLTPLKTSWPLLRLTQQCSKATCQTTQT